jgi:hypothetical protein
VLHVTCPVRRLALWRPVVCRPRPFPHSAPALHAFSAA